MTTALLMKLKVMGVAKYVSRPEPYWAHVGILKRKVEKHHVSNIQQLRDVIMEEWKRMPATTCAAPVNSMPRRIKAVLDGAPTKYDILDTVLTCSLRVVLIFVASYLDNNGYVLSYYLEDSKFVLLYKLHIDYSKIYPRFICVVLSLEKIYYIFLLKCEGLYSLLWDTVYTLSACVYYLIFIGSYQEKDVIKLKHLLKISDQQGNLPEPSLHATQQKWKHNTETLKNEELVQSWNRQKQW